MLCNPAPICMLLCNRMQKSKSRNLIGLRENGTAELAQPRKSSNVLWWSLGTRLVLDPRAACPAGHDHVHCHSTVPYSVKAEDI